MRRLVVLALSSAMLLTIALHGPTTVHAQDYTYHTVQPGETLYSIARHYGVNASALASTNNLVNPDYIYVGQRLHVPGHHKAKTGYHEAPSSGYHTVKHGETLYSIAAHYGTTVSALLGANNISNPDYIYAGQQLHMPGGYGKPVHQPAYNAPKQHCGYYYGVKRGDTLSGIAAYHGTTVYALASANGLRYPYMIYSGQQLHIPCHSGYSTPVSYHPQQPYKPAPKHHKPAPKKKAAPKKQLHPAACARAVEIARPLEGQTISGVVQVIGTAVIDDFQFYKVEYAHGHTPLKNDFHSINEVYTNQVSDTVLTTWFVGNLSDGPYTLRLTAVDEMGQFPQPCDVHVHVDN